jgi:hypothetical protein
MKAKILIFSITTKQDTVIEYAVPNSLVSQAFGHQSDKFYKDKFNLWFFKNVYNNYQLEEQFEDAKIEADETYDFSKHLKTMGYGSYIIEVYKIDRRFHNVPIKVTGRFVNFTVSIKATDLTD